MRCLPLLAILCFCLITNAFADNDAPQQHTELTTLTDAGDALFFEQKFDDAAARYREAIDAYRRKLPPAAATAPAWGGTPDDEFAANIQNRMLRSLLLAGKPESVFEFLKKPIRVNTYCGTCAGSSYDQLELFRASALESADKLPEAIEAYLAIAKPRGFSEGSDVAQRRLALLYFNSGQFPAFLAGMRKRLPDKDSNEQFNANIALPILTSPRRQELLVAALTERAPNEVDRVFVSSLLAIDPEAALPALEAGVQNKEPPNEVIDCLVRCNTPAADKLLDGLISRHATDKNSRQVGYIIIALLQTGPMGTRWIAKTIATCPDSAPFVRLLIVGTLRYPTDTPFPALPARDVKLPVF